MSEPTSTQCQHESCEREGVACYLPSLDGEPTDDEPDYYYCYDHCHVNGFCWSCGDFWSGVEDFDFDPRGLCSNCRDEYEDHRDEEYDYALEDPL